MAYNFEKAIASGVKEPEIKAYLKSVGREQEAIDYFNSKKQSLIKEAIDDIKQTGTALKSTFTKTKSDITEAQNAMVSGEQGGLRTTLQTTGLLAKGLSGAIGDLTTGSVKLATGKATEQKLKSSIEKIAPIANKIDEALGSPLGTFVNKYQSLDSKSKRDVNALLGIGNLALDIATLGGGSKAAKGAAEKALEVGKQSVKTGAGITGDILERAGTQSVKLAIPLSKPEAGLVQGYRANNPFLKRIFEPLEKQPRTAAITAVNKGLAGSESMIGVQAKRESKKVWAKIEPALNNIKDRYSFKDGIKRIENKIQSIAEPSRRGALQEALMALKKDYENIKKTTYLEAQEIKSGLDKFIPEKAYAGKPIAGSFKEVQKMLADDIRTMTYDKLVGASRDDFLDYGNLLRLQEWGKTAMTSAKRKAGFGSFVSNLYDKATIPVMTAVGKGLAGTGRKLKSLSK